MADIIQIEKPTETLSKEQVTFNKKILLIEKRKKELTVLKDKLEKGRQIIGEQLLPLEEKHIKLKRECITLLD